MEGVYGVDHSLCTEIFSSGLQYVGILTLTCIGIGTGGNDCPDCNGCPGCPGRPGCPGWAMITKLEGNSP